MLKSYLKMFFRHNSIFILVISILGYLLSVSWDNLWKLKSDIWDYDAANYFKRSQCSVSLRTSSTYYTCKRLVESKWTNYINFDCCKLLSTRMNLLFFVIYISPYLTAPEPELLLINSSFIKFVHDNTLIFIEECIILYKCTQNFCKWQKTHFNSLFMQYER